MAYVGAEPTGPELSLENWLSQARLGVALVFTDIVGSAVLVNGAGTHVYGQMLTAYRDRARHVLTGLGGRLISAEGDELFVAFLDVARAYLFARAMFDDSGHALISTRVGVHFGPVSCHEEHHLIGRAVPFAQRVMAHANPHQIWISDPAKQALELESPHVAGDVAWISSEACRLDGIPEMQLLWRAA